MSSLETKCCAKRIFLTLSTIVRLPQLPRSDLCSSPEGEHEKRLVSIKIKQKTDKSMKKIVIFKNMTKRNYCNSSQKAWKP